MINIPSHTPPCSPPPTPKRPRLSSPSTPTRNGTNCPYMPTIHPPSLDFDLPPVCQTTLQSHNIYICLICGKYLQGRSSSTPAYAHSLQVGHHLFLNFHTHMVYCLPDNYRVIDTSFAKLSAALRPTFSKDDVVQLDRLPKTVSTTDGGSRLAGAVPLDSLHAPHYITVSLQILLSASPLRDYLLTTYASKDSSANTPPPPPKPGGDLAHALANLCAKLWAPIALRPHIAPHELLQLVARESGGRFDNSTGDPVEFVAWMLNGLTGDTGEVARQLFRGELEVQKFSKGKVKKVSTGFWYLPMELPPRPLFKDANERTLVPQIALEKLLRKFDGVSRVPVMRNGGEKVYHVVRLPRFLFLIVKRFSNGTFGMQKNSCVVHLPPEGLDIAQIGGAEGEKYKLLAVVLHEGDVENGKYRIAIRHHATKSWYDLSDMSAKPTAEQLVSLTDTYLLLYGEPLREEEAKASSET